MRSIAAKKVFDDVKEHEVTRRSLPSRLVLKIMRDARGNIVKYKARLVAKGFHQVKGQDYDEVYAPTVDIATVRTVLADVVERQLHMSQFDVSTAFLSGDLEETVFLNLPPELGGKFWRLKKALYGLKQAARGKRRVADETAPSDDRTRIHSFICGSMPLHPRHRQIKGDCGGARR
jgi:hypothetical protein